MLPLDGPPHRVHTCLRAYELWCAHASFHPTAPRDARLWAAIGTMLGWLQAPFHAHGLWGPVCAGALDAAPWRPLDVSLAEAAREARRRREAGPSLDGDRGTC
jgi:hypothetical protein